MKQHKLSTAGTIPMRRNPKGPVFYETKNFLAVLFQCHGSTWPKVFPYCFVNIAIYFALLVLQNHFDVWISSSQMGHTVGGIVISFLLVSRVTSGLARYFECQGYITILFQDTRELVQKAIVYSRRGTHNNDDAAKEWRSEVAYRILLMLRTTVANIGQSHNSRVPAYEVPELNGPELEYCRPDTDFLNRSEIPSSMALNSLRVPILLAQLCRESICGSHQRLTDPLTLQHEMNLLLGVDHFMSGYYGMRKMRTAPVPFPLVQMADTLGLLYVFSLPMMFLGEKASTVGEDVATVFLLTYGFIGLALTAAELDDPFGDDPNDFDVTAYSRFAMDDALLMIRASDGEEWADVLRYKLHGDASKPVDLGSGLIPTWSMETTVSDEATPLIV